MSLESLQVVNACSVHTSHTPPNKTVEWHHLIPVAWQLAVPFPANPPSPGPDTSGRGHLWDNRGIWVCPTGHRNIHFWIVRLMKTVNAAKQDNPNAAYRTVGGRTNDFKQAYISLVRMLPFGSLYDLTTKGEWGQA